MYTMKSTFLALVFLLISASGNAVDFKPCPIAKVSENEFKQYLAQVQAQLGSFVEVVADQHLEIYFDKENSSTFAFTTEGHPAHPAWVARKVVERNAQIGVDQVGYFAGAERPFALLFEQYLELNEKVKEHISNSGEK